ncbi:MAG: nucleotidyltransferase family protein [Mycobacteriaceae bacterium]|uniref:nucleotidyltransferase family protein n=1 Tax=Corynebacterium sp. TaxID=1720 RepID=UPI003F9B231B
MSTEAALRPSEILRARRRDDLGVIRRSGSENPRVFGSVATGTDTSDSDIDILVKVDPEHAWSFVNLSEDLSELLGVPVDVVSEGGLKPKHEKLVQDARPL